LLMWGKTPEEIVRGQGGRRKLVEDLVQSKNGAEAPDISKAWMRNFSLKGGGSCGQKELLY